LIGSQDPEGITIKRAISQLAPGRNVRFIDGVKDGELKWRYENCELLIASSSMEGFALPVAEALLCGSRVICSYMPAFREIGGDAFHYFDLHAKSAPTAMAEAMCDALTKSVGSLEYFGRFSQQKITCEYIKLYTRFGECALNRAEK
jgi:glycosyltransferase involved in cell wall biosynthesis